MTTPAPPPSQIGIQVSGADMNSQAGIAARTMKQAVDDLDSIRLWSEAYTGAELETMGLQPGTGDTFKSAMSEVTSVRNAIAATSFLKRLWGTGT